MVRSSVLLISFYCSLAIALLVSTPPNVLAYATELLENLQLLEIGALIIGIGFVSSCLLQFYFCNLDSSDIFPRCACQSFVDAVFTVFKNDL